MVCEHEYMNIRPPPQLTTLATPLVMEHTVGAKSMSPVDIEMFVIIYNITIPLCITTRTFFLWELSNLNK